MAVEFVQPPSEVHINRTVVSEVNRPVDRPFKPTTKIIKIVGGRIVELPFSAYTIPPVHLRHHTPGV